MQPPHGQIGMSAQEYQARVNEDQLKLLSTFFMIFGILALVGSCFFSFYFYIGYQAMNDPSFFGADPRNTPPPGFGQMFMLIGSFGMLFAWMMGGLALASSKWLRERKNWTWIMIAACFCCLQVPLGTALGVFAIVVINRPSVRALFDGKPPVAF